MADKGFVNVLICNGCKEGLIDPYVSCVCDHKYCITCANLMRHRCKVCFSELVDPEQLRGDFPCVRFIYGCKFVGNMRTCADHQEDCEIGPIPCPFDTETSKCTWNGQLRSIWDHFTNFHSFSIRWSMNTGPRRDVLKKLRYFISSAASQKLWKDYSIVFCIEQGYNRDKFFVKFSLCPSGKLKYYVEYLEIDEVVKQKGFKYRVTFGAPDSVGSCTGNECGKPSYMAFKDLLNLCNDQGDLVFEISIFDKNTPVDDSAFEMVYND